MISAARKEEHDARPAWLWAKRQPITGTLAEHYLRAVYGITCALPPTLGYLPPHGPHHAAVIAAFGMAEEIAPGIIDVPRVVALHLMRLKSDGSALLRGGSKVTLGSALRANIVIAPPNDLAGLAVTVSVEEALAVRQTTGLGAWVATSAVRMFALADAVRAYVELVTAHIAEGSTAGLCPVALSAEHRHSRRLPTRLTVSLQLTKGRAARRTASVSTTLEDLFRPYGIPPSPLHEVVQEAARRAGWTPPWDREEKQRQKKLAGKQSGVRRAGLTQIRRSVVKVARTRLKSKRAPYSNASVDALDEEFRRLVADGGKNCASLARDKRDLAC